jgi:hypothetical protein
MLEHRPLVVRVPSEARLFCGRVARSYATAAQGLQLTPAAPRAFETRGGSSAPHGMRTVWTADSDSRGALTSILKATPASPPLRAPLRGTKACARPTCWSRPDSGQRTAGWGARGAVEEPVEDGRGDDGVAAEKLRPRDPQVARNSPSRRVRVEGLRSRTRFAIMHPLPRDE